MCAREDNVDYVGKMNDEFIKIYSNKNVININNNEDEDIKKINDWIMVQFWHNLSLFDL